MILYRVYPEIQDTLQGVLGDTGYFTGCIRRYRILYRVYQEIQNTLQGVLGDTEYFTGCIRRYRILYRVYQKYNIYMLYPKYWIKCRNGLASDFTSLKITIK